MPDWTVERLERLVALIAEAVGRSPEELLAATVAQVRAVFNAERARLRPYTRELADLRRARILPQSTNLDQVIRYENHLTRQLEKTLVQLRALQQDRAAAADPDAERPLPLKRRPRIGAVPENRGSGEANPSSPLSPSRKLDLEAVRDLL